MHRHPDERSDMRLQLRVEFIDALAVHGANETRPDLERELKDGFVTLHQDVLKDEPCYFAIDPCISRFTFEFGER